MWMDGLEEKIMLHHPNANAHRYEHLKYKWGEYADIVSFSVSANIFEMLELWCSTFVLLHFSLWNSSLQKKKWKSDAATNYKCFCAGQGCTMHQSLQPCSRAARKRRENEEMKRKWRENEEMERDWLSTFPHSLFISSPSIHFLYQNLSHFFPKC